MLQYHIKGTLMEKELAEVMAKFNEIKTSDTISKYGLVLDCAEIYEMMKELMLKLNIRTKNG